MTDSSRFLQDPWPCLDRIGVLGAGATGRAAARLLAHLGKSVVLADQAPDLAHQDLPDSITLRPGSHDLSDLPAIVLPPGLNPEWPEHRTRAALAWLWQREGRLPFSEMELATAAWNGRFISIGGTDGKSTTAAITAALLQAVDPAATMAGNSWRPVSDVLLDAHTCQAIPAWLAIEISAFQLWPGCRVSPAAAILTNIADDHLDHYATLDDYVDAKLRVTDGMTAGATVVLNLHDARLMAAAEQFLSRGLRVVFYSHAAHDDPTVAQVRDAHLQIPLPAGGVVRVPLDALRVPGAHNHRNALAAWTAALWATGAPQLADPQVVAARLGEFRGLPHRVQFVREHNGVRWYDDSKATNVHAAIIGIRAMTRPFVAIVGGVDKGLDLLPLRDALRERAVAVVTIGALRDKLQTLLDGHIPVLEAADSMEDAVVRAARLAPADGAVLLAPAASSFDMFAGFEARGLAYQTAIRALS